MSRLRPQKRILVITAAAAITLGLAACGDDTQEGTPAETGRTEERSAEALSGDPDLPSAERDFAGTSTLLDDNDLNDIANTRDNGVHAPGLELNITGENHTPTIDKEVYEDISGSETPRNNDRQGSDDDEKETDEVRAEDDHVFLVASYETSDPEWEPRDDDPPETTAQLRVQNENMTELFSTDEGSRHGETVIASIPQDSDPDDAVIEIETDGSYQSVSLLNGKRTDSDVPQAYPGPQDVTVESAETLDTSFEHFIDGETPVQGEVVDAFTTPYLDENDGDGWSAPGQVYLSVDVDWDTPVHTTYNETITRLETDDETIQPINDPSSLVEWFDDDVVFQIPNDLEAVEVVIEPAYQNGPSSSSEVLDFDTITAELALG